VERDKWAVELLPPAALAKLHFLPEFLEFAAFEETINFFRTEQSL
jgi:hypothetical protein